VTSPSQGATAERLLRDLAPQVLGAVVRRFGDFASAEDAVQEALLAAAMQWPEQGVPEHPRAWLIHVASRRIADHVRSEAARRRREAIVVSLVPPELQLAFAADSDEAPLEDDTLTLLVMCCHPALSSPSAIALTLRAVGGLTTAEIARAFLVPEATMAQRISRAKQSIKASGVPFERPTPEARAERLGAVLHVLYLIFNEGYGGEVDLAAEAIRLTRQLAAASDEPEVQGLLALMLLHHARRASRRTPDGELVPLADQDRTLWDTTLIAEGVDILQHALARDRLGEYQVQAAIAALHADARSTEETDWTQVLEWYDELTKLTDSPVVALNRAVAVGAVDGPLAGLRALAAVDPSVPRHAAVAAYLHERAGDLAEARDLYAVAARSATSAAERDHLTRQAARLRPG
jgi:RNA polymerase sigma factor (sigma-70 family)